MNITEKEMHDFIAKVISLRVAQKTYFKTRDNSWLNQSKKLEREVDAWITGIYTQGALTL